MLSPAASPCLCPLGEGEPIGRLVRLSTSKDPKQVENDDEGTGPPWPGLIVTGPASGLIIDQFLVSQFGIHKT
jgi:hypothetical protein